MKITVQFENSDGSVTIRVTRKHTEMVAGAETVGGFMNSARSAADECCDRAYELGLIK